jgi:hypothetical protein
MEVSTNFQELLHYLIGLSPICKYPDVNGLKERDVLVRSSLMSLKIPVSKNECREVLSILNKINTEITFQIDGSSSIRQILIHHIFELKQNIQ